MLMLPLIAIVIVGLLCACSATAAPAPTPSTKQLTEVDAGRSIELRGGDKPEVTLPGNPTTGFQWEVSVGDTAILRPSGEPKFEPSSVGFLLWRLFACRGIGPATARNELSWCSSVEPRTVLSSDPARI